MFGKLGDMMGKLQEMKLRAEEIKTKLDEVILTVEGAGGDITIRITGNRQIRSLEISGALQHGDSQELQEQLLVTINRAIAEADKTNEEEMKKAASGILPGL